MGEKEIIKANGALTCSGQLSRLEQVIFNSILAIVYDELPTNKTHRIPLEMLLEKARCNRKAHMIRGALKRIASTVLEFDILGKDGRSGWAVGSLLAWAEYKDGVVEVDFAPKMAKLLHSPAVYTRINALLSAQLKSRYTAKFYELALMWLGGRPKGSSGFVSVDDMRKLMGSGGRYPRTADFFNKTIKRAIDEIHANPHLRLSVEPQRVLNFRKVIGWKFIIRRTEKKAADIVQNSFKAMATEAELDKRALAISRNAAAIEWAGGLDPARRAAMVDAFKEANKLILYGSPDWAPGGEPDFAQPAVKSLWADYLIAHHGDEIFCTGPINVKT